jgi:DNA-directed RNA polymerase II subunit RPB11
MEMEVLIDKKEEAEFLIKGERHTFPSMLRDVLLKDSKVVFVAYKLEHPMDTESKIIIKTSGRSPRKALEDALKKMNSNLDEFSSNMKKAIK